MIDLVMEWKTIICVWLPGKDKEETQEEVKEEVKDEETGAAGGEEDEVKVFPQQEETVEEVEHSPALDIDHIKIEETTPEKKVCTATVLCFVLKEVHQVGKYQ